jgi:hypothetical protein
MENLYNKFYGPLAHLDTAALLDFKRYTAKRAAAATSTTNK